MRNAIETQLVDSVLARMTNAQDPRFKQIMASLVRHLHAFVRETGLTEAEWLAGIRFLTATGQKCDDRRQEFILLSDTLGVSMLVDAINHRKPGGATESTVLGPFYVPGAAQLPMWSNIANALKGEPAYVSGTITEVNGTPIAGATIDVWQTDGDGVYDVQRGGPLYARGKFVTGADGQYGFRTVKPVSYPIPADGPVGRMLLSMGRHPYRPAHVHAIVSAPEFETVTTHLFVKGDQYLDSDAVFGVKDSLVVEFTEQVPGLAPDGSHSAVAFCRVRHDFRLARA